MWGIKNVPRGTSRWMSAFSQRASRSNVKPNSISNLSCSDNRGSHIYISDRSFFKFNGGPSPTFFKQKKVSNTIVINKDSDANKEVNKPDDSLKSRILGFVLSKVMGFVAKTIHSQLKEMEMTFDTIVSQAENSLNSDPKLRDVLGSDIEIVDIRSIDQMKTEHNTNSNIIENAESDKYELKLDNLIISGSKGITCSGSLFASEEKDGDGQLVLKEMKVVLPNGQTLDVKIPKFSSKVIDIKV